MYIRTALGRPRHCPGKVRQTWQIGKDRKLRKAPQTGMGSAGAQGRHRLGMVMLTGIRKDSVEGAVSELLGKHSDAEGSTDRSHTVAIERPLVRGFKAWKSPVDMAEPCM